MAGIVDEVETAPLDPTSDEEAVVVERPPDPVSLSDHTVALEAALDSHYATNCRCPFRRAAVVVDVLASWPCLPPYWYL